MALELRTSRGRRLVSDDSKVYLKKNGKVTIARILDLGSGDEIAWEREQFSAKHREFLYERIRKRNPDLRDWLQRYERTGNYSDIFSSCYDKISEAAESRSETVDLLDEISTEMRDAKHPATIWTWLLGDESTPWLPRPQRDLSKLSKALRSLTKKYRVRGLTADLNRLEKMGTSDPLRELVRRIRGKDAVIGRSIKTNERTSKFSSRKGGGSRRKAGGRSTRFNDPISEMRRKAQKDYEKWLAGLPAQSSFDWAVVKLKPKKIPTRSKSKDADSAESGSWYRSFKNGPVIARGKRQMQNFSNLLGVTRKSKRSRVSRIDKRRARGEPTSEARSVDGPEPKVPQFRGQIGQPLIEPESVTIPAQTTQIPAVPVSTTLAPSEFQVEWSKLEFGLVQLRLNTTRPLEWSHPNSVSFTFLNDSIQVDADCTRHVLDIIPRVRTVELPETELIMEGNRHSVPGAVFEFALGVPQMGLIDVRGRSRRTEWASALLLQAGIELRRRHPKGAVNQSLRALDLVKQISAKSISESKWKGVDILKGEWQSEPRTLIPNLVIAEWLFETALAGLRTLQAEENRQEVPSDSPSP